MPSMTLEAYVVHLPARMAELKLTIADAVSVPHMKDSQRKSTLNAWEREARENQPVVRAPTRAGLRMLGIGVKQQITDHTVQ